MSQEPLRLFVEKPDVNRRLGELGLKEEILVKAARVGLAAWAAATPNNPKIAGGFNSWSESIRSLRDDLAPEWRNEEPRGMALVVNGGSTIAITTATGDYFTGRTDGVPKTASDKGPMIQEAVRINAKLLNRFLDPDQEREAIAEIARRKQRQTWVLLFHRDYEEQQLRCELSLPADIGADSCIDTWTERIILSQTPFGDPELSAKPSGSIGPQSPEINIQIKRIG